MRSKISCVMISAIILFLTLVLTSTSFAGCSTGPAGKAESAPYGLNIQGEASGTKLSGVIEISLVNFYCNTDSDFQAAYGGCNETYPNAAMARAALHLTMNNKNGDVNTHAFYVDMGPFPPNYPEDFQTLIMGKIREPILTAFFGGDTGQRIFLKEFSLLSQANIDGSDPLVNIYVDYAILANLTLAVN